MQHSVTSHCIKARLSFSTLRGSWIGFVYRVNSSQLKGGRGFLSVRLPSSSKLQPAWGSSWRGSLNGSAGISPKPEEAVQSFSLPEPDLGPKSLPCLPSGEAAVSPADVANRLHRRATLLPDLGRPPSRPSRLSPTKYPMRVQWK